MGERADERDKTCGCPADHENNDENKEPFFGPGSRFFKSVMGGGMARSKHSRSIVTHLFWRLNYALNLVFFYGTLKGYCSVWHCLGV
jgi:hypothetical protein